MKEQNEVIAFLKDPASYPDSPSVVECMETHGAFIFLAGDEVYKIKRAVKYPYMDFSTFENRRRAIKREIEVNRDRAPKIYIDIITINRSQDGSLHFDTHDKGDNKGEIVEWAVHMRRFSQSDLLSAIAERGELDTLLAKNIAAMIAGYHNDLEPIKNGKISGSIELTLSGLLESLKSDEKIFDAGDVARFEQGARALIKRLEPNFLHRSQSGFIRHCHGDLHLNNIVMIERKPVLFDAIEFDERLAEIDIFYDLAFLLMDLDHRGLRATANLVFNRYLLGQDLDASYEGLNLLPLYLSLRACVRAMVTAQRAQNVEEDKAVTDIQSARSYFRQALSCLSPPPARLVLVGGLSGTGKTTLATLLAPTMGAAPGAVHLRSDLERKKIFGVSETKQLPPECYTQESTTQTYNILSRKAALALKAGHSVIIDAVFAKTSERDAAQNIARTLGLSVEGLWLEAEKQTLIDRVTARKDDASDATPAIVEKQSHYDVGSRTWHPINANQSIARMQRQADKILGLSGPPLSS